MKKESTYLGTQLFVIIRKIIFYGIKDHCIKTLFTKR
jgi:hypothetical protein